jgi:hypothetical protein
MIQHPKESLMLPVIGVRNGFVDNECPPFWRRGKLPERKGNYNKEENQNQRKERPEFDTFPLFGCRIFLRIGIDHKRLLNRHFN